ncbi:MAG: tripartite tricarboxylate transporter substrate binding protein [Candidatus Atribacteria bacterium]|nr:tripartite tricarboxylate transporter substrate binding protein [Candidatus Atribacteria bacterium]
MKKISRKIVMFTAFAILISSVGVFANDYPDKPIEMVVPYAPGGRSDIAARILGKYFPKYLDQPTVIVNIAGASGTVGSQNVLESRPDGYRLLNHHESMLSSFETGLVNFTWNDFTVICTTVATDNVVVAMPDAPYSNWQELKEYSQKNPNALTMGVSVGSNAHLAGIVMNKDAGGTLDIALGGGGDTDRITKLLGGHLDLTTASVPSVMGFIEAGQLKPIVLQSRDKSKFLPNVQTWEEANLKGNFGYYQVIYAPPGTPDNVVRIISEAIKEISSNSEYIEEIEKNGIEVTYLDTKESIEFLKQEEDYFRPLFEEAGLVKK